MLTATFNLDYQFPFMLGTHSFKDNNLHFDGVPSDVPVSIKASYEDFNVRLDIHPGSLETKAFYGGGTMLGAEKIVISVSKYFGALPDGDGLNNFLGAQYDQYMKVALKALTRVDEYFKYDLHNPFLKIPRFDLFHKGAIWSDANGNNFGCIGNFVVLGELAGTAGQLGAANLNGDRIPALENALTLIRETSVVDELLSEAQTSIFERRVAKAVLDMAVACEISIKTSYFKSGSPAYEVINFLEEKGQIEASPVEMIGKIAERAFGESFKTVNKVAYEAIDNLFRCRNKVAHRAQLTFNGVKNGQPEKMTADVKLCADWWIAVESLRLWLAKNAAEKL